MKDYNSDDDYGEETRSASTRKTASVETKAPEMKPEQEEEKKHDLPNTDDDESSEVSDDDDDSDNDDGATTTTSDTDDSSVSDNESVMSATSATSRPRLRFDPSLLQTRKKPGSVTSGSTPSFTISARRSGVA